jgi:glycerate kinase
VARALAAGWSRARPDDAVRLSPLADGGEGPSTRLQQPVVGSSCPPPHATRWADRWRAASSGRPIERSSSWRRVGPVADDRSSSHRWRRRRSGPGLIVAAAIGLGVREVVLGLGGSATNDGGSGLLTALGVRFLDACW